ncbi:hypothetical protein [Nevskia ramosa]|uniref:hypothetical protein n=1 Tax=Nevskia ramosa TaxID=64002 RepID=UPI0023530DC1|nr:hypothetical protein [Nevskia ramosa]
MNNLQKRMRKIPIVAAMALVVGLAGCADDASGLGGTTSGTTGGTTGGTTSGTTAGTTGGTTSGTTAGTTGGTTSGTTAGTTGGTTSGTTAGTTGGTTSGTTGGTTSGTTGGIGGIICNPTSSTYRPIQLPNATAIGVTNGICLGCSVANPNNTIDGDINTISLLSTPVGLLGGSAELQVQDTATLYPAGRRAGFVIFDPAGALLTAALLQQVTVEAVNNGVVQSSADNTTLSLDLLGSAIIGSTEPTFASFIPTSPFNELRIRFGSAVNALATLGVFQACVMVDPNDPGTTTGGTTGGTTAGTTGGTTSGTTGGTTSGTTGGTTSGTTGGTTTGGTTGGAVASFCDALPDASSPLLSPNAVATEEREGLCLGCSVQDPGFATDTNLLTLASVNAPVPLLGGTSILSVKDTSTLYPAGRRAGFVIGDPAGALLTLTLLQNVSVSTLRNGVLQTEVGLSSVLNLDLLGTPLIGGRAPIYASLVSTGEFDEVRLNFRNVVGALAQLKVAQVCVSNN